MRKNYWTRMFVWVLVVGQLIYFSGCIELPFEQDNLDDFADSLGVEISLDILEEYPQSDTLEVLFNQEWNQYQGGKIELPGGSYFKIADKSFTPPAAYNFGEKVNVHMTAEIDTSRNELLFTFEPSGATFSPAAEAHFVWKDFEQLVPELINEGYEIHIYFIDEDDQYQEIQPEYVDYDAMELLVKIGHFSRYAVAISR